VAGRGSPRDADDDDDDVDVDDDVDDATRSPGTEPDASSFSSAWVRLSMFFTTTTPSGVELGAACCLDDELRK
jgi:hypothetical protein